MKNIDRRAGAFPAASGTRGVKMEKGIVQVIFGSGMGKTSMAIGRGIGALARGRRVIMIQFLKGSLSGETSEWLKQLEPDLKVFRFGKENECFERLTEEQKKEARCNIQNGVNFARKVLTTCECDMLILDEFLGILDQKILGMEELENLLSLREEEVDLILTGKVCPPQLKEHADVLTCIENVNPGV